MTKFSWPSYPKTAADFDALMVAIDTALQAEDLKPFQRPIHVGRKLWEALGWHGPITPPDALANQPGFTGDVLMAKAIRWYQENYGDQLKAEMAYGFVPAKLGNGVWRVRAGVTYGQIRLFMDRNLANKGQPWATHGQIATFNVLCAVEGLPQGLANRLSDHELRKHFEFHLFVHENLQWRSELPSTELFDMAYADYDQSTADVMAHRYGQARWGAQQAVEKTLKGLLTILRTSYPTGGPNGHNIKHLASLLESNHGVQISPALFDAAACSARVRYGEEESTEAQALLANQSVLGVIEQLRTSPKVNQIIETYRAASTQ